MNKKINSDLIFLIGILNVYEFNHVWLAKVGDNKWEMLLVERLWYR